MKNISEYINEKYNPLLNKTHNKIVDNILYVLSNALNKKEMSKEDVLDMLDDLTQTIKNEY